MIRLSSNKVEPATATEQRKWIDTIFSEHPYLENIYPNDTRDIGIIFCIQDATIEYFHLGVNPIFREIYILGSEESIAKGYVINNNCIGCGSCVDYCPQNCIVNNKPFIIQQEHCIHCGWCVEKCPIQSIKKR